VAAAPSLKHFWTQRRLFNATQQAAEDTGWGFVFFAPVEVQLGGPTAVQPDLFILRRDRLHLLQAEALVGVPDVIMEVLSPTTRIVDLGAKRDRYERAGVREYWIADPEDETLTVLALVDGQYVEVEPQDGFVTSTVIPGLIVESGPLFAPAG
jgi:Uma2 family endonuclease